MVKEEVKLVPIWAIRMITLEGYLQRFFYHKCNLPNGTYEEAYEKVEDEFQFYFETSKYKNFQSFRQMTYYYRNKKEKKHEPVK